MSDDDFLERLRRDAKQLKFEGLPGAEERIRLGVMRRIEAREGIVEVLGSWFRPIVAAAAAATITVVAVSWLQHPDPADLLASVDTVQVTEDAYHVAD